MPKRTNPRLPSCPRDPSRRLHPLRQLSSVPVETSPTPAPSLESGTFFVGESFSFEGPIPKDHLTREADSQGESVETARDSDSDTETEVVLRAASPVVPVGGQQFILPSGHIVQPKRQAMAAVRKFISPPIFRGSLDEDSRQWMERYETISSHNKWGDAEKRNNFRGNPATPAVTGLRSMFLKEFQPDNYGLFQETRLRSRTQGIDEPTVRYYYEILNLCRLIDSNMSKAHRLEHLFRGLRPALLRKIYTLKPKTCEEFLTLAKAYTEASLMSEARGWKDVAMGPQKPHEQTPNLSVVYPDQQAEFMKSMREFIQVTCEKLTAKEKNKQEKAKGPYKPKGSFTDGKPFCFHCKKPGHIARYCFKNPESPNYKAPTLDTAPATTSAANVALNLWTQAPNVQEEKHLLNFDGTNLIKEPVLRRWPKLSAMAKDLLSIPATSAASERAFSTGKDVFGIARMSFHPETVEALVCLRSWYKAGLVGEVDVVKHYTKMMSIMLRPGRLRVSDVGISQVATLVASSLFVFVSFLLVVNYLFNFCFTKTKI
ncbi:Uncharacterized protein APZ42_031279 [Daphnia magna]|uniref:CCHC-type domain-containing protein n=1 Tax=Daphnia magna TaxID=35525 RepID=A0A164MZ29_9CRUS|nr:Uncharacterized protein APZ42_031279 [Daphnia magna]